MNNKMDNKMKIFWRKFEKFLPLWQGRESELAIRILTQLASPIGERENETCNLSTH